MYVCVKQAYQNYATNMKVSIFILYDIYSVRLYQKVGVARFTTSI